MGVVKEAKEDTTVVKEAKEDTTVVKEAKEVKEMTVTVPKEAKEAKVAKEDTTPVDTTVVTETREPRMSTSSIVVMNVLPIPKQLPLYYTSDTGVEYEAEIQTSCSLPLISPWATVVVESGKGVKVPTVPINLETGKDLPSNIVLAFTGGITTGAYRAAKRAERYNEAGFELDPEKCGCECTPTSPPTPTPSAPTPTPPTPTTTTPTNAPTPPPTNPPTTAPLTRAPTPPPTPS